MPFIGLASGMIIGMMFKLTPIQGTSIGLATLYASGSIVQTADKTGLMLKGAGDIVTIIFTAALATAFILLIGNKTQGYAVLVLPNSKPCCNWGYRKIFTSIFRRAY